MPNITASPILVIEDEPKLAEILVDYLRQAGFSTHWICNGTEAVACVREQAPQLILLDIMLPGKDGMDVCREVRAFSDVPIVMVTARIEEIDRLLGLELGADDYICKPFSPREVVARVKAILRRRVAGREAGERGYLGIEVDREEHRASVLGRPLDLTPIEFRLLEVLWSHPGRVYSRNQLLDLVYVGERDVSDRSIDSHIKNLRRKVREFQPDEQVICTVYGVGYKLE
jgi:two-component system, OmpR family, response regulator BaeR